MPEEKEESSSIPHILGEYHSKYPNQSALFTEQEWKSIANSPGFRGTPISDRQEVHSSGHDLFHCLLLRPPGPGRVRARRDVKKGSSSL